MKKKISLLIAVIMTFLSAIPAAALDRGVLDSLLSRAAGYSAEERRALIENMAVFSGAEENLEIVCRQIDEQNGMVYSIIQPAVEQLGADCVKALLRSVKSFGCRNVQNALYAYVDAKVKPEPMTISPTLKTAMGVWMDVLSEANSDVSQMLKTDGINESVLAYMTDSFLDNVKDEELFWYNRSKAAFSLHSVSKTFLNSLNQTWENVDLNGSKVDAEELMKSLVTAFNTYTSAEQGYRLAQGLAELGLCGISGSENESGNRGNGSGKAPVGKVDIGEITPPSSENKIVYEQVDTIDGLSDELRENGALLQVGIKTENGIDTEKSFEAQTLFCFTLDGQNLMMYRFENGALTPVKYTAQTEAGFAALLERGGEYVVKDMAYRFDDVSGWAKPYIESLALRGIISGKADGIFAPEESITREEFVKLVVELFGMNDADVSCDFTDVPAGSWYYSYVANAAAKNIVNGIGDGRFGVGQKIRRQDMAKIIYTVLHTRGIEADAAKVMPFADDDAIASYAREAVLAVRSLGIISGDDDGNCRPEAFATRAEAAKMISMMMSVMIQRQ